MFWTNFRHKLRNIFITGLLAFLPLTITYLLLGFVFEKADAVCQPLVIKLLEQTQLAGYQVTYIPGLGIATTVIMILLLGLLVTNIVGGKLIKGFEALLDRIPLVRGIYNSSKQFIETISMASVNEGAFSKVVMFEYPRKGLYSIGFVTNEGLQELQAVTGEESVYVFIPTTPNPTSGMLVMAPKKDLIPLSLSIEEGIKLVMTLGFVGPDKINKPIIQDVKEDEIT